MSRASDARRRNRAQKRALRSAGIAVLDRVTIDSGALASAVTKGANLVDLVAYHVAEALTRLDEKGADIIHGTTAITIGDHPEHPGGLTIEAKASTLKRELDPDPGCPIDHSGDGED